eukprot:COSAG01_NODE_7133_length_3336_cov_3.415199_1_plen_88_part_00
MFLENVSQCACLFRSSICGLVEGQTSVDWSKQNLGPSDCKIIAVDLGLGRFSAAVTDVDMSSNPITGSKLNDDTYEMEYCMIWISPV